MPDFKALLVADGYYHIFNRAVGSERLFVIADNYRYFFQLFANYISPVADLLCFSLLPNHFHFFLRMKDAAAISNQMELLNYRHGSRFDLIPDFLLQQFSNCFNAYTKAFNKQQKRKGKLFMESFSRKSITTPECYSQLTHYIHASPVHHGYCKQIKEWPFSSYHELVTRQTDWIQSQEVIGWFGSLAEFIELHNQLVAMKVENK